jgi:hypothetical protein
MNMRWRVYYGDGSIYDPGSAYEAPPQDVQMIANADRDNGWSLIRCVDYYWYYEDIDEWNGGEIFGLFDYLLQPGPKRVLFGRNTTNVNFNQILQRALNDPDIPQKSGWYPHERQRAGVE